MKAVLFGKLNCIDKPEVRRSLIRIPEVIHHIQRAQKILEEMNLVHVELINAMVSDQVLERDVRNILVSAVHLGLFSRYVRFNGPPDFFSCLTYPEAPVAVCLGRSTFENLILESNLIRRQSLQFPTKVTSSDILSFDPFIFSHVNFEKYGVYHLNGYGNKKLVFESQSAEKIVEKLVKKYGVSEFINISADDLMLAPNSTSVDRATIQISNSIDLDPMLGWFWGSISEVKLAVCE